MIQPTQPSTEPTQRPARPGETCSCGRQAVVVYQTEKFGDVGFCGIPGAPKVRP